ncbi:hypothetical protein GOODEAATRI_018477 [Goodea atripinnis]|uniref:Uncharacterized protein n=1 Tax=Goodea atripinnis TaxID=208336 RepID=A0ABV0N3U8_9TELE
MPHGGIPTLHLLDMVCWPCEEDTSITSPPCCRGQSLMPCISRVPGPSHRSSLHHPSSSGVTAVPTSAEAASLTAVTVAVATGHRSTVFASETPVSAEFHLRFQLPELPPEFQQSLDQLPQLLSGLQLAVSQCSELLLGFKSPGSRATSARPVRVVFCGLIGVKVCFSLCCKP